MFDAMPGLRAAARSAARARHLWLAAALALPLAGHAARPACQLSALELPVALVGHRAVVTVGIAGKQVPLTLDTGAFFSMLTDGAAQTLQLEPRRITTSSFSWGVHPSLTVWGVTGRIDARMVHVGKLELPHGDLPGADFLVGGNEPGAGTMGLLGRNLLTSMDMEFDLAHGMVRYMLAGDGCKAEDLPYWSGTTPVTELELLEDPNVTVPELATRIRINGKRVRAELDTGATSMMSLSVAHDAGIRDADMTPAGTLIGAGRGTGRTWTAKVARVDIGGEGIVNNRLAIGEMDDTEMLLGIDFFLSHRLYVSRKLNRIFMTYNGGPVFPLNTTAPEDVASDGDMPASADAFARRGAARATRKDYTGALADLDKACELAPQSAGNFTRRGVVHQALKQQAQALADFDTALRLDPSHVEARLQRVEVHMALGERAQARADLDVVVGELAPQAPQRLFVARAYTWLDLPAQALPQWSQWLAAHPNEVGREVALNARCWARLRLGIELDAALADCDAAIELVPDSGNYRDSRAWLHMRRGEWPAARSDFDQSLKLRPDGAWTLYGRGLLRTRTGDADGGRADIEAARKLEKDIDDKVRHEGVAGDLPLPAHVAAGAAAASATR